MSELFDKQHALLIEARRFRDNCGQDPGTVAALLIMALLELRAIREALDAMSADTRGAGRG